MITLCLTTYQRTNLLFESFVQLLDNPNVSEIVIVDDYSDEDVYQKISAHVSEMKKVKLFRNEKNLGVYHNKKRSVDLANNEWVIIGDSDNVYDNSFIDKILDCSWDENTILAPDFAMPVFSYEKYSNLRITKNNVAEHIHDGVFQTLLNTFNLFIHKDTYLKVHDGGIEPFNFDSIYFNYCWLKAGFSIKVIEGLRYYHRIHPQSHFQANMYRGNGFLNNLINNFKELK